MARKLIAAALTVVIVGLTGVMAQPPAESLTPAQFAQLSRDLSEPGGYFDTDNLISNEGSYLHVLGRMRELGVSGGA